jgi:hypothetical protein
VTDEICWREIIPIDSNDFQAGGFASLDEILGCLPQWRKRNKDWVASE